MFSSRFTYQLLNKAVFDHLLIYYASQWDWWVKSYWRVSRTMTSLHNHSLSLTFLELHWPLAWVDTPKSSFSASASQASFCIGGGRGPHATQITILIRLILPLIWRRSFFISARSWRLLTSRASLICGPSSGRRTTWRKRRMPRITLS